MTSTLSEVEVVRVFELRIESGATGSWIIDGVTLSIAALSRRHSMPLAVDQQCSGLRPLADRVNSTWSNKTFFSAVDCRNLYLLRNPRWSLFAHNNSTVLIGKRAYPPECSHPRKFSELVNVWSLGCQAIRFCRCHAMRTVRNTIDTITSVTQRIVYPVHKCIIAGTEETIAPVPPGALEQSRPQRCDCCFRI